MGKFTKILSLVTFLFLITIILTSKFIKPEGGLATVFPFKSETSKTLKGVLSNQVKDYKGDIAIYIKNLNTGESYKLNENEKFEAGSLYKLWIMGKIFEKISEGKLKEDDNLEADIKDINTKFDIDEEDVEFKEGHLQFTISSAIEQMITISHNYASLMLLTKVSFSEVEVFLKKYGLKSSTIKQPITTTAQDTGWFLEKIYKGEVINEEYSQKMIGVLKRQKINDRLPKYLPEGVEVAHKTADIGFSENDVGIVFSPKGDFIIVVLTKSNLPEEAAEKIAQISKAVYEFFNK